MESIPLKIGLRRAALAAWISLATSALQAQDVPVLPSGEEVSRLSVPSNFKASSRQPLTRPLGSAPQGRTTEDLALVAVETPIDVISIDVTKLRAPAPIASQGGALVVGERGPAAGPLTVQL